MSNVIDLSVLGLAEKLQGDIVSVIYGKVITLSEQILRKHVMATVYAGGSSMYERTMGVLNAVEVGNINVGGTSATFEIRINPSKMGRRPAEDGAPWTGKWGAHMSFSNRDFGKGLIEILDGGGGSSWHTHPAHNFYQKTYDEADDRLAQVLAAGLAAAGWDVSF